MATNNINPGRFFGNFVLNKTLLTCGIYSALFYIITDQLASTWYNGYSIINQNYSELLATGAPTRPVMLMVSVVYNILVAAFAIGIWSSGHQKRTSKITGALIIGYAILSMVTPLFFQMDMRGAQATPNGSLHPVMTAVMSLFVVLSIGFGAFLLPKWFRIYSFFTIILLIVFGFITSLQVPQLALGQTTPFMGFTERINIYSTMLWFAVLSVALLKAEKEKIRPNEPVQAAECTLIDGKNIFKNWFALALSAAVIIAEIIKLLISGRPDYADSFSPVLLPFASATLAAAAVIKFNNSSTWLRVQRALLWIGLLLMVWTANGLPFDLLRLTPLMPQGIDWPGFATRLLALAAVIVLARLAFKEPAGSEPYGKNNWYGYAAFFFALPYPLLRTCWAFGGTIGLTHAGAAGVGFAPLIIAIPWVLAAVLALMFVHTPHWMSRRFLLTAGWSATVIVAMIGPAAFWMIITSLVKGGVQGPEGMDAWVPFLFYTSWFLFAIAIGAATRSYQLRTSGTPAFSVNESASDVTNILKK